MHIDTARLKTDGGEKAVFLKIPSQEFSIVSSYLEENLICRESCLQAFQCRNGLILFSKHAHLRLSFQELWATESKTYAPSLLTLIVGKILSLASISPLLKERGLDSGTGNYSLWPNQVIVSYYK